jgi:hypothetical protein
MFYVSSTNTYRPDFFHDSQLREDQLDADLHLALAEVESFAADHFLGLGGHCVGYDQRISFGKFQMFWLLCKRFAVSQVAIRPMDQLRQSLHMRRRCI